MLSTVHNTLTLYYSPLCIFGQVARLFCEEYYNLKKELLSEANSSQPLESTNIRGRSSHDSELQIGSSPQLEFIEVPLGVPSPVIKTVYRQTPTLIVSAATPNMNFADDDNQKRTLAPAPLIVEDYRMIWYELYGRFLVPARHASERAVLDGRTHELFHSVIIPRLTSPAGRRVVKASYGRGAVSRNLIAGSLLYRYWTAPLLLHRLRRGNSIRSARSSANQYSGEQGTGERERHVIRDSLKVEISGSRTAHIIERAAAQVLAQISSPNPSHRSRIVTNSGCTRPSSNRHSEFEL